MKRKKKMKTNFFIYCKDGGQLNLLFKEIENICQNQTELKSNLMAPIENLVFVQTGVVIYNRTFWQRLRNLSIYVS